MQWDAMSNYQFFFFTLTKLFNQLTDFCIFFKSRKAILAATTKKLKANENKTRNKTKQNDMKKKEKKPTKNNKKFEEEETLSKSVLLSFLIRRTIDQDR